MADEHGLELSGKLGVSAPQAETAQASSSVRLNFEVLANHPTNHFVLSQDDLAERLARLKALS